MPYNDSQGNALSYEVGAGFLSLVLCWFAALIRVIMHYCTPVPGGGVGCHCQDMARRIDGRTLTIDFSTDYEIPSMSKRSALDFQKDNPLSESGASQSSPQKSDSDSGSGIEAGVRNSSELVEFASTSSDDSERSSVVKAEGNQL